MNKNFFNSEQAEDQNNEKNKQDSGEKLPSDIDSIRSLGSVTTDNGSAKIHTLVIAGQIEGHYELPSATKSTKYEHVIPLLVEVEENDGIDGLLIILNTVGGDVEAGLALAELISGMTKPTVSLVLGGGHSIGVPLAVSAKKSFIVPSATMTIHPVRTSGTVIGVPQAFTYLRKMQERISDFIVKNSDISLERLNTLMLETDELAADIGTVIDGLTAVNEGLIDEVGGLGQALSALKEMVSNGKKSASSSVEEA